MPPPRMLVIDEVRAVDARLGRGVRVHRDAVRHAPRQIGDEREPRLVDVVEIDAIDGERRAGESAGEQRHAHAGAADDGELHEGLREERAGGRRRRPRWLRAGSPRRLLVSVG